MEQNKRFIGLIGAGYWGKNLARDFNHLNALHTICDISEKLLENFDYPNVNKTTNWIEMLNNREITAICIALPAEMHHKFGLQALNANKDVYIEKPLALSVEHCQELIDAAKERDCILMVGHLLQYHPVIEKIYQMIQDDYIGPIRYITSNRLNLGKIRKEENVLWSFAPHDISVIMKLMENKDLKSVTCHGRSFISQGIHDITSTIMEFDGEDDCYVQINVNWLNPYKEQRLVIVGTKGMITFDDTVEEKLIYHPEYMEWNKGVPVARKQEKVYIKVDEGNSPLVRECQHFIECCQTGKRPRTDGEEGLRVLEVLNMAQKSLLNNGEKQLVKRTKTINQQTVNQQAKYFQHETAIVDNGAEIGENTKIWHYSHLMKCKLGNNCNIGQNVFIADNVVIGNNCKVQNNVSLYDGVTAEDDVFFGPSCVFTNDKNPRAKYPKGGKYIKTHVCQGATIGANATIVCGITLGKNCLIGAGAVVTKDVKENEIVVGNPAKVIGKMDEKGNKI